jgi:hypothetical protein
MALAVGTEKARAELLIAPILLEVHGQLQQRFSLFSGIEFNVDVERGLWGVCDYLLSLSPIQLTIEAPAVAVVEAKNENIKQDINQCVADDRQRRPCGPDGILPHPGGADRRHPHGHGDRSRAAALAAGRWVRRVVKARMTVRDDGGRA